jgi:hypothetical protein
MRSQQPRTDVKERRLKVCSGAGALVTWWHRQQLRARSQSRLAKSAVVYVNVFAAALFGGQGRARP